MTSDLIRRPARPLALVMLLAGAWLSGGCGSKVQARTPTDKPPLDAPPPPPRVIAPAPVEETAEVVADPTTANPPAPLSKPRPAARANGTVGRVEPKAESKPETAAERVESAETKAPEPALNLLQTTPPGNAAEAERKIRGLLSNARRDLSQVDYRALKLDARAQYDTAKRFTQQAEGALKDKNFAFALKLADKAAELAAGLLRR